MTSDYTFRRIQSFMHTYMNRTVYKRCRFRKILSRLIGSGQPNHPSKRSQGQRDVLAPTGRSQWVPQSPGSLPPQTWVAAHGKHTGSPKPLKETFRKRYIDERINKAEIRLGEQSENTESCRENLWNEIQVKGP